MALDPLKRSRQRQGPSPAFHTIGVQGYFGSVQPPLSEIPGSAPVLQTTRGTTSLQVVEWHITQLGILLCRY